MGYTWISQLNYARSILGTGLGVFIAALVMLLFLLSFVKTGRWAVLTMLLYSSSYSFNTMHIVPLITPLEQIRHLSEVLTVLFIGFLILPALMVKSSRMQTPMLAASVAFWVLEVTYALRVLGNVDLGKAMVAIVIFTSLLLVFAYGLPRWLRGIDDIHAVVRCMGFGGLLFVGSTIAQLLIHRSAIVFSGRLFAITGNPQYAALVLAISLIPVCFLLASGREKLAMRVVWGATTGLIVGLLILTGSRTGVLTAFVGIVLLFRRRLGRFLVTAIVVAAFVFAAQWILDINSEDSSRLFSTLDTRSSGWKVQIQNFLANPFFGRVTDSDWGTVENSYLTIAGRMGVIGLCILGAALWFIGSAIRRLRAIRKFAQSTDQLMLIDFVVAGLIGILVGAILEGILVGTLTYMLLALYLYLGLLKFLSDQQTLESAELFMTSAEYAPPDYRDEQSIDPAYRGPYAAGQDPNAFV